MQPTVATHIEETPGVCGGKPRIAGTRIRVQEIVLWTEQGMSADEIVAGYPHLTLADVYAALAYYHDHRDVIDRQIREDHEWVARMMADPTFSHPRNGASADANDSSHSS